MREARRAGIVTLLLLLAGGPLLLLLPAEVAAVRVGGIGLLWWYCLLVTPAVGLLVTAAGMPGTSRSALTWVGPALFVSLAFHVFVGAPEAPFLVLAAVAGFLLAPLVAVRELAPGPVIAPLALVGLTLLLAADLRILADLAGVLGGTQASGLIAGAVVAWLLALCPAAPRWRALASAAAIVALAPALVVVAATGGGAPWEAWERQASRLALEFAPSSHWIREGDAPLSATTLIFSEPHRITALSDGVYRVVEREGDQLAEREWRLTRGDTLTLRAGDELTLTPQTRVRFEAGKRVPGAAASGMAWADPPNRRSVTTMVVVLGVMVTLVGGAIGLTVKRVSGASRRRRLLPGIIVPVLIMVSAAWWGVYAALDGPQLILGPARAMVLGLSPARLSPPWDAMVLNAIAAAAATMFVATALVLHARSEALLTRAGASRWPLPVWTALVVVAAVVAVIRIDPWHVLVLGFGVLATVLGAPALTRAGTTARTAGALVGGLTFVVVALVAPWLGSWMAVAGTYPALVAAPLAWGVTRLGQGPARRRRSAPAAGDLVAAGRPALRQ